MAKAYKCDRCGKFYEENVLTQENRRIYTVSKKMFGNGQAAIIDFDLCGDCQCMLEKFLLKQMFTPEEVCEAIHNYEHDPDTIFIGQEGHYTYSDIRKIVEGMVDDK